MSLKAIQFIMAAAAAESFIMGLLVISQLETLQSKRLLAQPFLVLWLYTLKPCLSLKDIARKSFHFQEGNRTPRFSIKARRRQIVSRGFFFLLAELFMVINVASGMTLGSLHLCAKRFFRETILLFFLKQTHRRAQSFKKCFFLR